MRIRNLVFVLLPAIFFAGNAEAQQRTEWVFFKTKGPSLLTGDTKKDAELLGISDRALQRRAKVLPADRIIDEYDLPVSLEHIEQVRSTGAVIRGASRWLNAVLVQASPEQFSAITKLHDVQRTWPAARKAVRRVETTMALPRSSPKTPINFTTDYGSSLTQLTGNRIVNVHRLGINGTGVIIGMLDDGYNMHRTHDALKTIAVLAERDFVQNDNNTMREPGEYSPQGNHGTYTLSAVGGFRPGELIGAAYGASFMLGKTEIDSIEVPYEEVLYVQGLEWLENLGADIVSTSLGYIDWYQWRNLDGKTATTSKAARILAAKGILLVTAAGNEGWYRTRNPDSTGTLIAPSDADSILGVGMTSSDGELSVMSSTGPSADGRIKPDLVTQGLGIYAAFPGAPNNYTRVNGTSLATPLVAGAAALLLSARPELTPMQVREALVQTTRRATGFQHTSSYPNNFYGYGGINALDALLYHGMALSNEPVIVDNGADLVVTLWVKSKHGIHPDSVALYYQKNGIAGYTRARMAPLSLPDAYFATVPKNDIAVNAKCYFGVRDSAGEYRTAPFNAPTTLFSFEPTSTSNIIRLPDVGDVFPKEYVLSQNFPNPFNPSTRISFTLPRSGAVELVIFNSLGQRVRTLFSGGALPGTTTVEWDGMNDVRTRVGSGVYFYRLTTSASVLTKKMVLIK